MPFTTEGIFGEIADAPKKSPYKAAGDEVKKLHEILIEMEKKNLKINIIQDELAFLKQVAEDDAQAKEAEETPVEGAARGRESLVFYPRDTRYGRDDTIVVGPHDYTNYRDLLARFFLFSYENYMRKNNWRKYCIGITSCIFNGQGNELHMPMYDYDGKNIKTQVKKDIKKLQKEFGFGDATIYTTRSGVHVFFFTDAVNLKTYMQTLEAIKCCEGFTTATKNHGYATLRVSAKYTKFDIQFDQIIQSPRRNGRRPGRKAHLIQELIRQGQECGTHFAALYPQWALFIEDSREWRNPASAKKGRGKVVRKLSKKQHAEMMKMKDQAYQNKKAMFDKMYNT